MKSIYAIAVITIAVTLLDAAPRRRAAVMVQEQFVTPTVVSFNIEDNGYSPSDTIHMVASDSAGTILNEDDARRINDNFANLAERMNLITDLLRDRGWIRK